MSDPSEFERNRDGFESDLPTLLFPPAKRFRDTEGYNRLFLFEELFDSVPLVVRDHALLQQIGDNCPSFTLVPLRSSRVRPGFTHLFTTAERSKLLRDKLNFTIQKRDTQTSPDCGILWQLVTLALKENSRDTAVPLTNRGVSPTPQTGWCHKKNSITSNQCLITDGGTSVHQQVLDDNGVGQKNDYAGKAYSGSEAAIDAIETYLADHVADKRIASSRSIANTATDVRIQEIGKTLGAHLRGDTPDGFIADVEVSKWRDTSPVKWVFTRVAGEADTRRSRQLQKPDLVREITRTTDAGGARYEMVSRDGTRWEKANTTVAWKRDVLAAVCETTDHQPAAVDETEDLDRREWIDQLTQAGTTDVLERAIGIEAPGARDHWNRETLQVIHDVVVAGRDLSEVGR